MQNKSLKCAACGTPYTPDMKFCASCGAKLSTALSSSPSSTTASAKPSTIGRAKTAKTASGKKSGPTPADAPKIAPANAPAITEQTVYACPNCGQEAKYGAPFCTRCGAPFDWQPGQPEQPVQLVEATAPPLQELQADIEKPPDRNNNGGRHYGKDDHSWFLPFMVILSIAVVAAVIVILVFSDAAGFIKSFSESPVTTVPYTISTPAATTPAITTTAPTTATAATREKQILIKYSGSAWPEIGGHIYPESGNAFLVVDLTIENQGYDQFNMIPLGFEVTVNKTKYNADISSSSDIAGVLQPQLLKNGQSAVGKLAFEVLSTTFISDFKINYTQSAGYNIVWVRNQ